MFGGGDTVCVVHVEWACYHRLTAQISQSWLMPFILGQCGGIVSATLWDLGCGLAIIVVECEVRLKDVKFCLTLK